MLVFLRSDGDLIPLPWPAFYSEMDILINYMMQQDDISTYRTEASFNPGSTLPAPVLK